MEEQFSPFELYGAMRAPTRKRLEMATAELKRKEEEQKFSALAQARRAAEEGRGPVDLSPASPGGMNASGTSPTDSGYSNPAYAPQQPMTAEYMKRLMTPPVQTPFTNLASPGSQGALRFAAQQPPTGGGGGGQTLRNSVSITNSQRGGAGGAPASEGVGWADYLKGIRDKRGELDKQLEDAYRPPDYSTLAAQAIQRGQDATKSNMAGILAGLGPQAGAGFSKGMAARAADLAGNMKVTGGEITPEGEVMLDPGFQAQRKIELLAKRIDALDKLEQAALSSQEKAEIARRHDAAMMEMRRLTAAVAMSKKEGAGEKFQTTPFVNSQTGAPVSFSPHANAYFQVVMTPQGPQNVMVDPRNVARHGDVPAGGVGSDTLPGSAPAQDRSHYTNASRLANTMPGLIEQVEQNKDAFGVRVGLAERVGGTVGMGGQQVPLLGKELTEQQQATRAQVYLHYGRLLNELIGTAQTPAETTRLLSFVPGPNEDADGIIRKMRGAIEEANRSRSSLRQNYGLTPSAGNPSLPGAKGASFEERYGVGR